MSLARGMVRIFVMDQVHRVQSVMPFSKVLKVNDVIFGALRIKANGFHLSAVNDQKHEQVDGAMADVLELSLFNLALMDSMIPLDTASHAKSLLVQ